MTPSPSVFRFAPSPNGYLHLGHAYSALVTADMARRFDGRLLLRLEDIDLRRCRPEYEAQIFDDLRWLGLSWEEPVRRQSEHFDTYRQGIGQLESLGVVYPCFATRSEITAAIAKSELSPYPHDPDGVPVYPGLYKNLPDDAVETRVKEGEPYALRLDMGKAVQIVSTKLDGPITFNALSDSGDVDSVSARPEQWGDVVIARKDLPTSYHLSVVMDDAAQGITHVTRGSDLLYATDIHRILQVLLEYPEPIYFHHRLILDEQGRKLSKAAKDTSLKELREAGVSPDEIRRMVGLS